MGIAPHNTFLYVHLAYGGMCAYIYLAWLLLLSTRIFRMMLGHELPMDTKLLVVAMFGMGLGAQLLSNQGYVFLASMYGIAVVEKYTHPYRRSAVLARAAYA
jgi:hypothetical protein